MRALIVLALFASTARADHEAYFGSHVRALRSDSANALTEQSLAGPAFGYGYRLPVDLVPKLELWGTARMMPGFATGKMFQTIDTHVTTFEMAVGVLGRYPVWRRYLFATAHVDAGAQWLSVELEDMDNHTAADTGWGMVTTAALGVEAAFLTRRSFSMGMRLELGYVMTSAVAIDARAEGGPDDTIELDRMAASLGTLDLGGRYFAATFTTRF